MSPEEFEVMSQMESERDALRSQLYNAKARAEELHREVEMRDTELIPGFKAEIAALKARIKDLEDGAICHGCDSAAMCDEDGCCVTCGTDIPAAQGYVHRTVAKAESTALRAKLEQVREALAGLVKLDDETFGGGDPSEEMRVAKAALAALSEEAAHETTEATDASSNRGVPEARAGERRGVGPSTGPGVPVARAGDSPGRCEACGNDPEAWHRLRDEAARLRAENERLKGLLRDGLALRMWRSPDFVATVEAALSEPAAPAPKTKDLDWHLEPDELKP